MEHGLQHVIGLVNLFTRHGLNAKLIASSSFTAFFRGKCAVISDVCFSFFEGFLVARLINGEKHLIFLHQLVITHINRSDKPGDIRCDRHDVSAETRIARPRRLGIKHPGAENSDERQDYQRHGNGGTGDISC
ncbi:hypothetical protein D3C76_1000600 [compost metagenome]